MDCRVPYPSDPPRVRAVRLGPGNTVQATRDVPIFPDDTVETALVKIAAAFGTVAATGPAPYVWKSKQPLAFNISATAWRPGYQVNPFKVTPEAAAAETAALAPTVTYQLKALVRTRIGEPKGSADAQMVYVAFPEDVPAALRANAHYFGIAQSALRRPREVAKETEQLLALWTQPTAAHPETPCHFNRVTFQADVPTPSAPTPPLIPRAHATDIQSLYERLHARVADFSLIQWVADPTRVLYKLAENHTIPPAFLETWTSADRIPAAGPMLQMYSLLPGRAERDLFAKIVITPTKIRIVYHLDPREKIGADDLYPHAERLRRRLEDLYGTSLTFTETELSARTDIALPGLTVPRFAKIASGLRGVFQVIQLTKANTLDMLAVRTENYAIVEISDYIASKLRLGIPQDVIYAELSDIGETDAAIQDALDRARDIVRATPGILPPAELQRRVQTGLHVFISFAGFGLRVQLNGALHRSDLTRTLHWIRCIAIKTAAEAPVPAAAAPVPAEAVAGPSRRPLSPPLPAAAAPAVPPQLISPAVSVTSEEDLSFLEGGAVGREDQRYFLSHLQAADPKLFLDAEGYAAKCGATPFRQPIVVSKGEKATMDAEGYGTAYDSAIEYGSDAAHQNIYMCPRIWCQVSRRPLTLEQYRTTGCPRKEKPMLLYNHSYWNNAPETPHHISFHKDRTKTGLCMPCCGIKPVKAAKLAECAATPGTPSRPRGLPAGPLVAPTLVPSAPAPTSAPSTGLTTGVSQTPGARKKEEKNLLQQRGAIPEGRYGTVPKPIHDILLPNTAYQLCTTTLIREECAVRRGVASPAAPGDDAFLPALLYILDFPSTEAFAKALRRRLDPITFMTLENGRILQAFAPTDPMYPEDLTATERREFYRWLREQTAYRKRFQLPDPDALPLYAASRELALYKAYEAFFAHLLAPEEPKNPYTFYDIARLFGVALILWERTGPQVAQIRCPYFQTTEELLRRIGDSADEPRVAMILQDGAERAAVYEPIELRKVSGTAEQKLTQARVGHRFLKDTLVRGCTGTAAGAGAATATDGLGALRALAQWIETMIYDPTAFRLRTLVLAPDLSVSRVVTEVGVHVLLPVAMRPSPRELNAALTLLPTIRNILHHEDLQGTTRRVECLDRDLTQFRNKLRDLGLGDEAGRVPEAAPAGVFSSIFTVPPPDPQDVFPILLAGTRSDADIQRVAEETERSREIRRMEQRVGQTLLFYHDTLVAPLLGRPRSQRVQTLANTFPDVPVAQRARLHQILESLPLDSPETLAAHLRNISIAPRLPFHTPEIHLQRERKDRSGQWVFSQAAVETGLPSAMMQPIAPGSARPRGEKLPQPIHERIRAAEAAPVASARPRPALLSDVAEKTFPVKWTDIRAYSWSSFKILHRIEQQPTDIPTFFAWLSGELRVPLVWSEVQFATFQAISRALRDAAATEAVSDDPNFRNAWLRRAGRAPTTGRTQFSKLIERTNAADRQRLWTEIGPATVAAWPADTTLLMAARLLDISILLLLERARPTGPLRRGGLEDLAASSIFLTGADDLKSVLQRPLVLFFKELGDAHFTYSVIETPAHQPYFQMAGEAPKDVQKLIQTHLIAQKE